MSGRLIGLNYAAIDDDNGGNREGRLAWLDAAMYTANAQWGQLRLGSVAAPFVSYPPTRTPTPTSTATATSTATPTSTWTVTPSATPTSTSTATPTPTRTATSTATPTATPTTGDIAGTVWHDVNGDGMQSADELGLVGVTIKLFRAGLQVGQTTTTGDGAYRFAGLLPGAYTVTEVQPAWLLLSTTPDEVIVTVVNGGEMIVDFGDWNGPSTATPTSTPTPSPTSTPTETPTATATSTVTPTPTATPTTGDIAGTVWYDANGDGAQDADEPGLANVSIKLFRAGVQVGQAMTGGDGTYRFVGLLPGVRTVREVQPAWLRWSTTPNEVTVEVTNGGEAVATLATGTAGRSGCRCL